MKNYLAIFLGSKNSPGMQKWMAMSDSDRKAAQDKGKKAWGQWIEKNSKSIVYMGGPLGKTKKVDIKGISDISNMMTAHTVVQADSHEAAAKMFLEHPHFAIFPGESIEVMECLPIPS